MGCRARRTCSSSAGETVSHDFNRWFNVADSATLAALEKVSVNYTDKPSDVAACAQGRGRPLSMQQPGHERPAIAQGRFSDFADSGHCLLLVHPGLWYNWKDWPEYNRVLVGGGAHGHDRYGEFEVVVKEPNNPIMAGVPATFKLSDELYHSEIDPQRHAHRSFGRGP